MAKPRRSPTVTRSGGNTIIVPPPPPPPLAKAAPRRRRASGGGGRKRRRSSGRRRRGGGGLLGGYSGASLGSKMIGHGVGGFAVGFIEKSFPQLPTIPLVGKKGAIALAAYFLHGRHPIIADIGLAAAAISGYELGSEGHITGDVMGLASQM